jgi:hypothetical protein
MVGGVALLRSWPLKAGNLSGNLKYAAATKC